MSRGFVLLALLALLPPARANVTFVRVWPQWRQADVFKRIAEYFTGHEYTGAVQVRRSQPADRAGFYYFVRVKHRDVSLAGAKFILLIITPLSPEVQQFTFAATGAPGEHVFELGLTGRDWPGRKAHPVAWKLDLVSAEGRNLASARSFLWSQDK